MALFDLLYATVTPSGSPGSSLACCSDGTYVWVVTMAAVSGNRRLWRLRHSDKSWIKPDGSVGDGTNAYQTMDAYTQNYDSMVAGGNYIAIDQKGSGGGITFYKRSDMSLASRETGCGTSPGYSSTFDGTYFYFCDSSSRMSISRIHATTLALTRHWYVSATASTTRARSLLYANGYIYLCSDVAGKIPEKIRVSDATRVAQAPYAITGLAGVVMSYDAIRDELIIPTSDGEIIRVRCSDMAYLTPTGGVAGSYAAALIASGSYGSTMTNDYGCVVLGDQVYSGGVAGSAPLVIRRSTNPARASGIGFGVSGYYITNGLPCRLVASCSIDNTVYYTISAAGTSETTFGLAYQEVSTTAVVPAISSITPMTGPKTRIVFDAAVTVGTPTIGAPADGAGITGATQVDSTTMDLNLAVRPDHPTGEADYNNPRPPTGVGAVIV